VRSRLKKGRLYQFPISRNTTEINYSIGATQRQGSERAEIAREKHEPCRGEGVWGFKPTKKEESGERGKVVKKNPLNDDIGWSFVQLARARKKRGKGGTRRYEQESFSRTRRFRRKERKKRSVKSHQEMGTGGWNREGRTVKEGPQNGTNSFKGEKTTGIRVLGGKTQFRCKISKTHTSTFTGKVLPINAEGGPGYNAREKFANFGSRVGEKLPRSPRRRDQRCGAEKFIGVSV